MENPGNGAEADMACLPDGFDHRSDGCGKPVRVGHLGPPSARACFPDVAPIAEFRSGGFLAARALRVRSEISRRSFSAKAA
jgi:hypothetical protein